MVCPHLRDRQGVKAAAEAERHEKIREVKASLSSEQLCKGLPVEFALYFDHIRSLGFEDRPDYAYLKQLFRDLFFHEGFEYDSVYDWDL
jgi:hypothetical protein